MAIESVINFYSIKINGIRNDNIMLAYVINSVCYTMYCWVAGVYELVMFQMKPGYTSQFAHRLLQGLPDRLAMDYPHPLGFWFTEFGQSNQRGIIIIMLL